MNSSTYEQSEKAKDKKTVSDIPHRSVIIIVELGSHVSNAVGARRTVCADGSRRNGVYKKEKKEKNRGKDEKR